MGYVDGGLANLAANARTPAAPPSAAILGALRAILTQNARTQNRDGADSGWGPGHQGTRGDSLLPGLAAPDPHFSGASGDQHWLLVPHSALQPEIPPPVWSAPPPLDLSNRFPRQFYNDRTERDVLARIAALQRGVGREADYRNSYIHYRNWAIGKNRSQIA